MSLTEVFLLDVPKISDDQFNNMLMFVSPDRVAKVQRLKSRNKQLQSLLAKLLLRAALCDRLKVQNSELEFAVSEKGKPYLKNCTGVHFSISHTDSLVAVALSNSEVGVDVEAVRPLKHNGYTKFLTPDEQAYIGADSTTTKQRFFEVWTKKEAYFKRSGEGIGAKSATVSVLDEPTVKTAFSNEAVLSVCCVGEFELVEVSEAKRILQSFLNV